MNIHYKYFLIPLLILISASKSLSQISIVDKKPSEINLSTNFEIKIIPKDQLASIKTNYNWKNENYLIINYKNLPSNCTYDIYTDLKSNYINFEQKAFSKLDLNNSYNIFVYADKNLAKNLIDYKIHFDDIGLYFMKNYFDTSCVGVIVINQKGEYLVKYNEYNTFTISQMLEKLK